MATIVTSSIGTAGRDYSTLQSWEDACPADLVTADQVWKGECYNDSEFLFTGSGIYLVISGITADATRYVWLTCAAGHSFQDHASVRTNPLCYDAATGVGIRLTGDYAHQAISSSVPSVRIERLQVRTRGLDYAFNLAASSTVRDCVVVQSRVAQLVAGAANLLMQNLAGVIETSHDGGVYVGALAGSGTMVGSTIVRSTTYTPVGRAHTGYPLSAISCAVFGFTALQIAGGSTANCATDRGAGAFGAGSGHQYGVTYSATTPFTQASTTSPDLRPVTGTALVAAGARDAGATSDISGTARATSPTIGAWELTAGDGHISLVPRVLRPQVYARRRTL